MIIIPVEDKSKEKEFIDFPKRLYEKDPYWVCPLDEDIKDQFNPAVNPHFQNGEAKRWLILNESENTIGRLAAFYSKEKASAEKVPAGGIGFFECINNKKAAHLLFDTAIEWLESKELKAVDAPINFGENDSNWGLLVDGFTHPGYGMPYNFPYYQHLFESYGFQIYFRQYSYHLDLKKKFPERFWKIAEWIGKKPDFSFRHFEWNKADEFINDLVHVYNIAWKNFKENFTPLKPEDVRKTMMKSKPVLDPELIWFAYYKDEPISFFIMFPDVNQILKEFNGEMNLLNKLKFLYFKNNKKIDRIRAQVAGVVPKFQNSGVESGIFWHMNEIMKHKPHYKELELSWVGDFNPKMISLYRAVGGELSKTHHTYRYMIDNSIPFERFMPEKLKTEDQKTNTMK